MMKASIILLFVSCTLTAANSQSLKQLNFNVVIDGEVPDRLTNFAINFRDSTTEISIPVHYHIGYLDMSDEDFKMLLRLGPKQSNILITFSEEKWPDKSSSYKIRMPGFFLNQLYTV